ncbi:MAG: pyridoxamine 5'-phosphate oxidase [Gammaproteobacteria bacterium]|nr:MAG: pyridoxamine 5'-phosphate oxidase [Gammaproteobacteria bacterium]UCH41466.1 MAG: pyridoxamine 5'-phosphate oxidase [Gammaproteobacteria bacterium]
MTIEMDLSDVRRDYEAHGITRKDMDSDPFVQFGQWLQRARDLELLDATAMTLATADAAGQPSARIVLLKHFDAEGFCWYTDSRSLKGQHLEANPNAAILFHWRDLSRQVRVHGRVRQMPADDAEKYFLLRPEGSRFSAAASIQSTEIESRSHLEDEVLRLRAAYPDGDVPRPDAWIGYRLTPEYFEFWQGQDNRLHDRIVYSPVEAGWEMKRISP